MVKQFIPYQPSYSLEAGVERSIDALRAVATVASHLVFKTQTKFAASVEITDQCNAGCHYCYVYPSDWDQSQRMQGYMQLSVQEHREKEKQVFETLEKLKKQGIVHLDFNGENVGKCVLRDEILCETCVCNITGLAQGINAIDLSTILGIIRASFG